MSVVFHHPDFIHSGADRKKEGDSERSQMEEINEKEDAAPSSPQTPQTPQTPQRPVDSSKGHAPPKRFHSVLSTPPTFLLCVGTNPAPEGPESSTPESAQGKIRLLVREQNQDCGSSGAGMGHHGFSWR